MVSRSHSSSRRQLGRAGIAVSILTVERSVEAHEVRIARAGNGGPKAIGTADESEGRSATRAVTEDGDAIGIGDAPVDESVQEGEHAVGQFRQGVPLEWRIYEV
jgi:hypothetical protein